MSARLLPILLLVASGALAEPYQVGDQLRPFSLDTQHQKTVEVGADTRLILATHDMDAGKIARAVLDGHTEQSLAQRGAVYIANIAGMPGFVSRFMAIPRMRRRSYPVLLDRKAETAKLFPGERGKVTVIELKGGRITALRQVDAEAPLRELLGDPPLNGP